MTVRAIVLGVVSVVTCVACQSTDRPKNLGPAGSHEARLQASPSPAATVARPAIAKSSAAEPTAPAGQASPATATGNGAPRTADPARDDVPQGPPAGTLPPPRPSDPPTHATVEIGDLAKHVGETLRFQMKDGRSLVGTVRSVENGTVRMERDMGLGITAFQIRVADVDQVLKRLQ
jgi:hypothetical protein